MTKILFFSEISFQNKLPVCYKGKQTQGGVIVVNKKLFLVLLMSVMLFSFVLAEVSGPIVDKVYMNVRTNEEIALRDVAEGNSDFFMWGVTGRQIRQLDRNLRDKLEVYAVPSASWSILINPYPAEAPYIATVDGEPDRFNPFAIQEIRHAMHFLWNRQFVVDEIFDGAGQPMMTAMSPGQPGTEGYNMIASEMGITAEGNEEFALQEIEKHMQAAADLPELDGRLYKDGDMWMFDGEPVDFDFVIRVDDPNRVRIGDYISRQLRKAGITANQLLYDRFRSSDVVYGGNAGAYEWTMYTEGWGAGATRRFWEHIAAQMYSRWYAGYQPGGLYDGGWQFEVPEIEEVSRKANTGEFTTEEEYYELAYRTTELGLKTATRIHLATTLDYYVTNAERFNDRFVYGLGDGPNEWSWITADTNDGVLNLIQYSATGALFMGTPDPIGTDSWNDTYLINATYPAMDPAMFEHPGTAVNTPYRVIPDYDTHESNPEEVVEVSTDAIYYDPMTNEWKNVEPGTMSQAKTTYSFKFSNYHSGNPMGIEDILYTIAYRRQMMTDGTVLDGFYNAAYESQHRPVADTIVAWDIDWDNETVTTYYNYDFTPSVERTAARGAAHTWIGVSHRLVYVDWVIIEALTQIILTGSESGSNYALSPGPDVVQFDLFAESLMNDLKAKLEEMIANGHVPSFIDHLMSSEEAVERYERALNFIEEKGHAIIGNGPFVIDTYDPDTNYIEYSAFRCETYPYSGQYWKEFFNVERLEVEDVILPSVAFAGDVIQVEANVIESVWPQDVPSNATNANVTAVIIVDGERNEFPMEHTGSGNYFTEIPSSFTINLESNDYVILIEADQEDAVSGVGSGMVVLY